MHAATIDQLIRDFNRLTKCNDDVDTRHFLQQAYRSVALQYRLILSTYDVTLTANQERYTLPEDIAEIRSAHYLRSATEAGTALEAVSLNTYDEEMQMSRYLSASTPNRFVVQSSYLILSPRPNTTTSNGYPIVRLETCTTPDLPATGSLVGGMPTHQVVSCMAAYQYCLYHRDVDGAKIAQTLLYGEDGMGGYQAEFNHFHAHRSSKAPHLVKRRDISIGRIV